jgi:3-keto-disaccharide hydrolase
MKMDGRLVLSAVLLLAVACTIPPAPGSGPGAAAEPALWRALLDPELSQWEVYLSYRHTTLDVTGPPLDENGAPQAAVGLNPEGQTVFSVLEEDGEPVLHVSGEIYGCLGSREAFENYRLKLQVKWGEKRWPPRLEEPKDTGLLYHSIGDYGVDYWLSWKLSQELQIMQDAMGDYWSIAGSKVDIRSRPLDDGSYRYDPAAQLVADRGNGDYCQRGVNYERRDGEWNTIELVTFGDRSVHIVNGHVVMALEHSRYFDGTAWQPLTRGALQIQSEAAEAFYKGIEIRSIDAMPAEYVPYFE